jgi:cyclopropane fatty-acyl-phospholipid synthase-like methyltransferase
MKGRAGRMSGNRSSFGSEHFSITGGVAHMADARRLWERYAQRNAEFFILTTRGVDFSTKEGQDYFFASGEKFVKERLAAARPYLSKTKRALDIGCGIGRLAFPHARAFDEVFAVDLAQTMLDKLNAASASRGIRNVKTFLPDARWDEPESFDYVYSFLVFQHIESSSVIESYIAGSARALAPAGVAHFHFDTRPHGLLYRARNRVPSILLPSTWRRGVRRIRRRREELLRIFERAPLEIIDEQNSSSEMHTFLLRKSTN